MLFNLGEENHWLNNLAAIIAIITPVVVVISYYKYIVKCISYIYLKYFPFFTFNVAVFIESNNEKSSGLFNNELKKELNRSINQYGLDKIIKLKDFGDLKLFSNNKEAEKYIESKKLDLIIWGDFSTDGLKNDGKDFSHLNINFTYLHPNDEDNKMGILLYSDINHTLSKEMYWDIVDNSRDDILKIKSNLLYVGTYILGLITFLYGNLKVSCELFEFIINELKDKDDPLFIRAKGNLLNIYSILAMEYYWKKNLSRTKYYCEKILELSPNNKFGLINLAYSEYVLNNPEKAEKLVELIASKYPNFPSTFLNLAFFRLKQMKYPLAFKYYIKFMKVQSKQLDFNILPAIEFLNLEFESSKDPGFIFASAILNYLYADEELGRSQFKDFLSLADQTKYYSMHKFASKMA